MQVRLIASLVLFIGSYLPLSLILLAQDFRYELVGKEICWPFNNVECLLPFRNAEFSLTILSICFICFCLSILALASVRSRTLIDIREAKYVPAELMNYTLPYVVSFMSLDYQEIGKFVGLVIFLGWMFTITYRSGQLILNPLLIVFGWRLYEIRYVFPGDNIERIARVLSTKQLQPGERYKQTTVQEVMIIKSDGGKGG